MTTTIDTDGRATGDTTPTRVLDLRPGDIIQTSWNEDDLAEVLLTTPIDGMQDFVLIVFAGGKIDQVGTETTHQVVTGERADQWRAARDAGVRVNRFCDQLVELTHQFRVRELPMPSPTGANLTVHVGSDEDVERAAKALGVEVHRTEFAVSAEEFGEGDLSVRFQRYLRPEVDE